MKFFYKSCCLLVFGILFSFSLWAQRGETQKDLLEYYRPLESYLASQLDARLHIPPVRLKSVDVEAGRVRIYLSAAGTQIPFREALVQNLYAELRRLLPEDQKRSHLSIYCEDKPIEYYIPEWSKQRSPLTRERIGETIKKRGAEQIPLLRRVSHPYDAHLGLSGRHIALWQSHGWYYDKSGKWRWQRPDVYGTVEDLFTQTYVLPYLLPMLENAGAVVLLPRERDLGKEEFIVDNDKSSYTRGRYSEKNGAESWHLGAGTAFAYQHRFYRDGQNPFEDGSYRIVKTHSGKRLSRAVWTPDIKDPTRAAVYVSYKSLPNSATDAHYTVHHSGGTSHFLVNQRMGGGTWIYLGSFLFHPPHKGVAQSFVELSNESKDRGAVVTADAVKIGGGMGNVERNSTRRVRVRRGRYKTVQTAYTTSGMPRYAEGARYWMLWSGVPDTTYNFSKGKNDYVDDYRSRGWWVNWLAGGSSSYPEGNGLGIPIDLAMALHSDAGYKDGEEVVGSLAIFNTQQDDGRFAAGGSRRANRDLADAVQSSVVNDIRECFDPSWKRRGLWDRNYSEATWPKVPVLLLEMLSHQNRADMQLGLDPQFRFTVSRAIYKGLLRFIAQEYQQEAVVQPLPPTAFSVQPWGKDSLRVSWRAQEDPLEPTAKAKQYILYTRINDEGFDDGVPVQKESLILPIKAGQIYRFKVTAVNDGGESFPSETLAFGRAKHSKSSVLVVNGFDRVSGPDLYGINDGGVPDRKDIKAVEPVAGNSFDYVYLHGQAILASSCSFASASRAAVEEDPDLLKPYSIVDLLLGKQRRSRIGLPSAQRYGFEALGEEMRFALESYLANGGKAIVTGAYLASDLANPIGKPADKEALSFLEEVFNVQGAAAKPVAVSENVLVEAKDAKGVLRAYPLPFFDAPNEESLYVNAIDFLYPQRGAHVFMYTPDKFPIGMYLNKPYSLLVSSLPFELIKTAEDRAWLMNLYLRYLSSKA